MMLLAPLNQIYLLLLLLLGYEYNPQPRCYLHAAAGSVQKARIELRC